MQLASDEARALRDEHVAGLSENPADDLIARFNGQKEQCGVTAASGRRYEMVTSGSFDHPTDDTSDFYVWIQVRPAWAARIPIVRWLLSARTTLIPND